MPRAAPLPLRVLRSLVLQSAPPARGRWRKALSLARLLARDPSRLPREIGRQRQHPRHEGRVLPDLVLVRLRR